MASIGWSDLQPDYARPETIGAFGTYDTHNGRRWTWEIRSRPPRKRKKSAMMKKNDYVLIVGCGRFGSYLANRLSAAGHSVVVIDRDERAFANLTIEFSGFKVLGDATELTVLKQGGIERADCVLATAQEDNVNFMVAQAAKVMFNRPKVMARVADPARETAYHEFGIEVISPIVLAGEAFMRSLNGRPEEPRR
jgi:trk system potassium uptake protein TrkA